MPAFFFLALFAGVLIGVLAGCGGSTVSGGDPGNVRLSALSAERVFSSLPPGSRADGPLSQTPARYAQPGFGGGGWHGPAVTLTFTGAGSPTSVFSYYEGRLRTSGWTATGNRNVLGFPQVWTRPYPGASTAYLTLVDLDLRTSRTGWSRYVLNASA